MHLDNIQDAIWQLRQRSMVAAVKTRNFLMYDGAYCKPEVFAHLTALEMIRNQMLADTLCICEDEVEAIFYGAKAYLGKECADPVPDYTKQDRPDSAKWVLEHPDCVLYDHWLDYLKAECKRIGFNFEVEVLACKSVGLDLIVTHERICSEVLLNIKVEEFKCNMGINLTVEQVKKCQIDFDVHIVPLKCDISFDTYVQAISCGIELKTLVTELKCGATIKTTANGVELCPPDPTVTGIPPITTEPEVTPPPIPLSIVCPVLPLDCSEYNCENYPDIYAKDEGNFIIGMNPDYFPVITNGQCGDEEYWGAILPFEFWTLESIDFEEGNTTIIYTVADYTLTFRTKPALALGCPGGGFDRLPMSYTVTDPCGNSVECVFYWISPEC